MFTIDIANFMMIFIRGLLSFGIIELFALKKVTLNKAVQKVSLLILAIFLHHYTFNVVEGRFLRIFLLCGFVVIFLRLFYIYAGTLSLSIPAYAIINVITYPLVYMCIVFTKQVLMIGSYDLIMEISHGAYIIQYIGLILVLRSNFFKPYHDHMRRLVIKFKYVFYSYLGLEVLVLLFLILLGLDRGLSIESAMFLWFPIVVIFLLIFTTYLVRYLVGLTSHLDDQVQMQGYYMETVEELYDEIRQYKHDFNNVLIPIAYLIEHGHYTEANKYIKSNMIRFNNTYNEKCYIVSQLQFVEIPELKGLVLSKYQWAKQQGIQFSAWIDESVHQLEVDVVDLCRMIGVLLDNAIEASMDHKEASVYFELVRHEERIKFIISNNFSVNHIDENFMLVSSKDANRGLGLKSLNRLVERYHHINLETHIEKNKCIQILSFFIPS